MCVQFNVVLVFRAFEKQHQRENQENDAAEHPELIHVCEQHRLALHGFVEVRHGKVAMIRDTAWRSCHPGDGR